MQKIMMTSEHIAQILLMANTLISAEDWLICSEDAINETAEIIAKRINISAE